MFAGRPRNRRSRSTGGTVVVAGTLLFVIGAMLATFLTGCGSDIFTVNGQGISKVKLQAEVNRRLTVVRNSNPKELEGSRGQKLKASTERDVATEMIKQALMEQQATKLAVTLAPDAVKQQVEKDRAKAGADKFSADLKKQGISESAYADKVKGQLLVDAIGSKVCSGVTVTRDEAESFYLTNKDLFTRSLMVHAAHILLETRGEAESVVDQVTHGMDFAQLAQSVSRDTATRAAGGDLGWIEQGTMDPSFESAAFGLKSGQVSGVVSASDGFHVIKVLERREASTPVFADVSREAMNKLETRKKDELFGDWLRTVYANALVNTGGLGTWDPRLGLVTGR